MSEDAVDPRRCATPRELFGEAVADARALKRAYAKLLRTWDPEREPEAFQHLRRLYEAGIAALEAAPAPVEAGPLDEAVEQAWVDAQLAAATPSSLVGLGRAELEAAPDPEGWEALMAALRDRALERGSVSALLAWIGLLIADDPTAIFPALTEAARVPSLAAVARGYGKVLLSRFPVVVDHQDWKDFAASLPEQERRAAMVADVEARLVMGRADAWERWEEVQGEVRTLGDDVWLRVMVRLMSEGSTFAPAGLLERWIERFESAQLGLDDGVAEQVIGRALAAQGLAFAWQREELRPLVQALLGCWTVEGPHHLVLILRLLVEDPAQRALLLRMRTEEPGVWRVLLGWVERVTGRRAALWARQPEAAQAVDGQALMELCWSITDQRREDDAARERTLRRAQLKDRVLQVMLGSVAVALFISAVLRSPLAGGVALVLSGLVGALHVATMSVMPVVDLHVPPDDTEKRLREGIRALCAAQGVWVHEVALGCAHPLLDPIFDDLLQDPLSDLGLISDAHVRRFVTTEDPA
jgi:hypothetical protein